jgi:hypothetical protein
MRFGTLVILTACAVFLSPALRAADAHVHGEARLTAAIDDKALVLTLETPADNLVGFEHAPKNDKERAAIKHMEATLKQGEKLFTPTLAADCRLASATIDSDMLETAASPHDAHNHNPHDAHDHKAHDHDDDDDDDGHEDVIAEYRFLCANPEHLRTLDAQLFRHFPGIRRLHAEVAAPNGQKAQQLNSEQTLLNW